MTTAADVFLSYKAEDRARLRPLVTALEEDGLTVWWDAKIGGGSRWRQDIQEHLDSAKCVIVVWTKRSVGPEGQFVHDEATRAQRRGTYLPVRLDPVEPPLGFGEIQALPLRGWKGDRSDPRYVALVESVRRRIAGEDIAPTPAFREEPLASRRTVIAGGVAVAVVAGSGVWLLRTPADANAERIAVMPFANLSGDPTHAYFSDGIAEELRTALSQIGLEVIGRESSDVVKMLDIKLAASKLGVANVLTGSVRRSPDKIRIKAQLVSGSDGVDRWTRSFDRAPGDAIKIQTEIAASVAQALSIRVGLAGHEALVLGGTKDSVAQDLFLQSEHLTRETVPDDESLRKRLALIDAALARDPNFAVAHVHRSHLLRMLGTRDRANPTLASNRFVDAEAAANRATVLSPRLGSAYGALAMLEEHRFNFERMLNFAKRALALSPNDLLVLSPASYSFAHLGDREESLRLTERCIALDPFHSSWHQGKAAVLAMLRRFPEAIAAYRRAIELAPDRSHFRNGLIEALSLQGRYAEAKAELRSVPANARIRLWFEALMAARTGDKATAERTIERLKQQDGEARNYDYGRIYALLGNKDQAFLALDQAIKAKEYSLIKLKTDPLMDPIRADPHYAALLRSLRFPS